jgi:hypothetical protein
MYRCCDIDIRTLGGVHRFPRASQQLRIGLSILLPFSQERWYTIASAEEHFRAAHPNETSDSRRVSANRYLQNERNGRRVGVGVAAGGELKDGQADGPNVRCKAIRRILQPLRAHVRESAHVRTALRPQPVTIARVPCARRTKLSSSKTDAAWPLHTATHTRSIRRPITRCALQQGWVAAVRRAQFRLGTCHRPQSQAPPSIPAIRLTGSVRCGDLPRQCGVPDGVSADNARSWGSRYWVCRCSL